jgi:DNA end-binding protein Ku
MARALWKGSISFGLVNIPIELHTAVRDHRPKFRMLHAKDKSPVKFERVCIRDGSPVAWQDLVKGYEYQKGHFVVLTKEDFQAAALNKTRTVDIIDFVKADEIDDRFFETRCCARRFANRAASASRSSSCATRSTSPPSR